MKRTQLTKMNGPIGAFGNTKGATRSKSDAASDSAAISDSAERCVASTKKAHSGQALMSAMGGKQTWGSSLPCAFEDELHDRLIGLIVEQPRRTTNHGRLTTSGTLGGPAPRPVSRLGRGPLIFPVGNFFGLKPGATRHAACKLARFDCLSVADRVAPNLGHDLDVCLLPHRIKIADPANVRNGSYADRPLSTHCGH